MFTVPGHWMMKKAKRNKLRKEALKYARKVQESENKESQNMNITKLNASIFEYYTEKGETAEILHIQLTPRQIYGLMQTVGVPSAEYCNFKALMAGTLQHLWYHGAVIDRKIPT